MLKEPMGDYESCYTQIGKFLQNSGGRFLGTNISILRILTNKWLIKSIDKDKL